MLSLFSIFAGAGELELRPKLRVEWPSHSDTAWVMARLPSVNGALLKTTRHDDLQVFIRHDKPALIANETSVKRYWNEYESSSRATGGKATGSQCRRLGKAAAYTCERQAEHAGKHPTWTAEKLVWNGKDDLILIRASSPISAEHAKKLLGEFRLKGLPAEAGET